MNAEDRSIPTDLEVAAPSEEAYYDRLAEGENRVVVAKRFSINDLWRTEDWWVIWLGFAIMGLVLAAKVFGQWDLKAIKFKSWASLAEILPKLFTMDFLGKLGLTFLILAGLFTLGMYFMGKEKVVPFIKAFAGLFVLGLLAYFFSSQTTMKQYLEYAFWALGIGLVIANTLGTPAWLKPALHSEYYVKTGLVIMGSEVLFSNLMRFGFYGLGIAWFVVPVVILFMWFFGTRVLKMGSKAMVMVIAVATSVCGVSAAIAAAAATKAKKNDLTFAVGLSMLFTVIMMILMPPVAQFLNLGEVVGGAWIGNTVDSTGAVVLAGEALGESAAQVATMVKMIQNVLIGFIAFAVAIFFASKVEGDGKAAVGPGEIWDRLPKFIFGFLAASLVFSFLILPNLGMEVTNQIISTLGSFKGWAFCLAFLSIGLETNFKDMSEQMEGGKPMTLYLVGQVFSLVLSLLMCWVLLSGLFLPVPNLSVM